MQTDRTRIIALAADYDTADKRNTRGRVPERAALVEAIATSHSQILGRTPSGDARQMPNAIRAWVAASRRTGKRGRPPSDRTHRLDVPATAATRARIEAHAERTGRTRATVAGDFLEVGAIAATNPPKGDGGSDE